MSGWAADLLELVIERSIVLMVATTVVGLVWMLVRRRVSASFAHALWLLPIILTLAPLPRIAVLGEESRTLTTRVTTALNPGPTVALPLAEERFGPAQADAPETTVTAQAPASMDEAASEASVAGTQQAPTPPVPGRPLSWAHLLLVAWGAISLVLLLLWGRAEWITAGRLIRSQQLSDSHPVARRVAHLARIAGLQRAPRIRVVEAGLGPAIRGTRRPTLLLPDSLLASDDRARERWVLLHELAHVRRRDPLVQFVQRVFVIAFWFHPAAWFVSRRLDVARECACDDLAQVRSPRLDARTCARAFLDVIEEARQPNTLRPAFSPLLHADSFSRRRFMRLLDPHRPLRARTSFAERSLLTLLFMATGLTLGGLLPEAHAQRAARVVQDAEVEAPREDPADVAHQIDTLIAGALETLVASQQADGRFLASKKAGGRSTGEHGEVHVTALCLRALSRLGTTKAHAEAANRAEAWLRKSQDEKTGRIGPDVAWVAMTGHAVALLALAEREQAAPDQERRDVLQKAINFAEYARNPYRAWRFGIRDGDNDTRVTSAMLRGLAAAREAGLPVRGRMMEEPRHYLASMHDPETGRWGFTRRDDSSSRLYTKKEEFPADRVEEPTSVVLSCLFDLGETPLRTKTMRRAPELLLEKLPEWSISGGRIDFSYWHFGTEALEHNGGWQETAWDEAIRQSLIPHAQRTRDGKVSWPPIDAWSGPGLEAWATAINALTLHVARPRN